MVLLTRRGMASGDLFQGRHFSSSCNVRRQCSRLVRDWASAGTNLGHPKSCTVVTIPSTSRRCYCLSSSQARPNGLRLALRLRCYGHRVLSHISKTVQPIVKICPPGNRTSLCVWNVMTGHRRSRPCTSAEIASPGSGVATGAAWVHNLGVNWRWRRARGRF